MKMSIDGEEAFFCYGCSDYRKKSLETTRRGKKSTCKICSAKMIERSKQTGTTDTRAGRKRLVGKFFLTGFEKC